MGVGKTWARRIASANNFDLVLADPTSVDSAKIVDLLDRIQDERHRGLSLSARADKELRRWSAHPETPLKSEAYVLLSNWFLTQSGDRHSMVAGCCEALWDELFPCRPLDRLSSPEPGRNHVILPDEFDSFWSRMLKIQGQNQADHRIAEEAISSEANVTSKSAQLTTRPVNEIRVTTPEADGTPTRKTLTGQILTIREAKIALALTFGVSPDHVEITIRG